MSKTVVLISLSNFPVCIPHFWPIPPVYSSAFPVSVSLLSTYSSGHRPEVVLHSSFFLIPCPVHQCDLSTYLLEYFNSILLTPS
jgi:hypothetical protein